MPLSFSLACALSLYTHVVFHTGFCFPLMEFWRQSRRSHSVSFHHELRVGANAFTQTTTPPHQTLPMPREKENRDRVGEPDKRILQEGTAQFENGSSLFSGQTSENNRWNRPTLFYFFLFRRGNYAGTNRDWSNFPQTTCTNFRDSKRTPPFFFFLTTYQGLTKTEWSLKYRGQYILLDYHYAWLSFRLASTTLALNTCHAVNLQSVRNANKLRTNSTIRWAYGCALIG